jgi:hypothetical protein
VPTDDAVLSLHDDSPVDAPADVLEQQSVPQGRARFGFDPHEGLRHVADAHAGDELHLRIRQQEGVLILDDLAKLIRFHSRTESLRRKLPGTVEVQRSEGLLLGADRLLDTGPHITRTVPGRGLGLSRRRR